MDKVVFITGGTGMLGCSIIEQILITQESWTIYVLYRSPKTLATLNLITDKYQGSRNKVIPVLGDISDMHSLRSHVPEAADAFIHTAAATSQWSAENDLLVKVNVEGTNNVIKICLEKGVKKLVYTSSIAAYSPTDGACMTEDSPKLGEQNVGYYNKTKYWSELNVLKAVREDGLQACILNPTQVLGKYDTGSWVHLFHRVIKKELTALGTGSGCFANCTEVGKAHVAAIEHGRVGENYILGGPSRPFYDLAREVMKLQGESYPIKILPNFVVHSLAYVADWYSYLWSHTRPFITPPIAYRLTTTYTVDSTKARNELGYKDDIPFEDSVREEYEWVVNPQV